MLYKLAAASLSPELTLLFCWTSTKRTTAYKVPTEAAGLSNDAALQTSYESFNSKGRSSCCHANILKEGTSSLLLSFSGKVFEILLENCATCSRCFGCFDESSFQAATRAETANTGRSSAGPRSFSSVFSYKCWQALKKVMSSAACSTASSEVANSGSPASLSICSMSQELIA